MMVVDNLLPILCMVNFPTFIIEINDSCRKIYQSHGWYWYGLIRPFNMRSISFVQPEGCATSLFSVPRRNGISWRMDGDSVGMGFSRKCTPVDFFKAPNLETHKQIVGYYELEVFKHYVFNMCYLSLPVYTDIEIYMYSIHLLLKLTS